MVSVIVDPFSQQLIKYYNCSQDKLAQATVSRASLFDVSGGHLGPDEQSVPLDFSKAIFNGFYANDDVKQHQWVSFDCPSGNCTFGPFTTVALCSECFDVTRLIPVTCPAPLNVSDEAPTGKETCWHGPLYRETATALPVPGVPSWYGSMTQFPFSDGLCAEVNYFGKVRPLSPWELPFLYCQYFIGYSRRQPNCSGGAGPDSAPTFSNTAYQSNRCLIAIECHLYPCVRTISSTVNNGLLTEKTHSSRPLSFDYHGYPGVTTLVNNSCLTPKERTQLGSCYTVDNFDKGWGFFNATAGANSSTALSPCSTKLAELPDRCTYVFDYYSWNSFGLMNSMDGNLSQYNNDPTTTSGPSGTQLMFNEGNFDVNTIGGHMQDIADSFTGYIRRSAPDGFGVPAVGNMTRFETCIAIRWGWCVAPITWGFAAIAFYVALCWHLIKEGGWRYNWKSSVVALIMHGLQLVQDAIPDTDRQRPHTPTEAEKTSNPMRKPLDDVYEIKHAAKKNLVQFIEGDSGWVFRVFGAGERTGP